MFFDQEDDFALQSQSANSVSSTQPLAGNVGASVNNSVVFELIYANENERHCPTIMPYPQALIDRVSQLIMQQLKYAESLRAQEALEASEGSMMANLLPFRCSDMVALEVQRVKFFLSELLRVRVSKIEALCQAIYYEASEGSDGMSSGGAGATPMLTPPTGSDVNGLRSALSANELMLADRLADMQQQCVVQGGLHLLPAPLQRLTPNPPQGENEEILPKPNTSAYVFVLALENLDGVVLDVDVTQEVRAGDIFLAPYRSLAAYVVDGRARLP